jgi:hypothetical protein
VERSEVIRPAAVLPEEAARAILAALRGADVSRGGIWNASSSLWQRYDRPWDALTGQRGDAELIGTICVTYDVPSRYYITVYRVTVTEAGLLQGWTVNKLCDDAFGYGGLTLDSCPRADLHAAARVDPFRARMPSLAADPIFARDI